MNARDKAIWLDQRRHGLGGSDIGAILGLSPYRTPVEVWLDKTCRSEPQPETLQMRFGTYAEEFVAKEYSNQTGLDVQRYTPMLHHPTAPLLGNVDRLVIPAGQKRAAHQREIRTDTLLECKTASAFSAYKPEEWGIAGSDAVPMSYLVQVATYRILTGCTMADLAVLFGNQEVRIYHLPSDAELEQMIIARATEWWNAHIVNDVPPEPVSDADIRALYPASRPDTTVEATEMLMISLGNLRNAKKEIAHYEKLADLAAIDIKAAIGDAEALTWNGQTLATFKSSNPGSKTDWKGACSRLAAHLDKHLADDIISMHTTETAGSRRFLLKDEK